MPEPVIAMDCAQLCVDGVMMYVVAAVTARCLRVYAAVSGTQLCSAEAQQVEFPF